MFNVGRLGAKPLMTRGADPRPQPGRKFPEVALIGREIQAGVRAADHEKAPQPA